MSYGIALVLVAASVIFLMVGVVAGSGTAHLLAALTSAAAVVLLYRRIKATRAQTFVTSAPPKVAPEWQRTPVRSTDDDSGADDDPIDRIIDGYDDLVAAEILPSLETLSVDELRAVIARERGGLNRAAIINRAEALIRLTLGPEVDQSVLGEPALPDPDAPEPAVSPPSAPARKRAASKTAEPKSVEPKTTPRKATPRKTVEKAPEVKGPEAVVDLDAQELTIEVTDPPALATLAQAHTRAKSKSNPGLSL